MTSCKHRTSRWPSASTHTWMATLGHLWPVSPQGSSPSHASPCSLMWLSASCQSLTWRHGQRCGLCVFLYFCMDMYQWYMLTSEFRRSWHHVCGYKPTCFSLAYVSFKNFAVSLCANSQHCYTGTGERDIRLPEWCLWLGPALVTPARAVKYSLLLTPSYPANFCISAKAIMQIMG